MGYLSKKKQFQRTSVFLSIAAVILGVFLLVSSASFADSNSFVYFAKIYRFQWYILSFLLMLFALWYKFTLHASVFLLFFIVNYFYMASHANIFHNVRLKKGTSFETAYSAGKRIPLYVIKSDEEPTLIIIDFSKQKSNELKTSFNKLEELVLSLDEPVVVAGDFGTVVWSDVFKKFLIKTNLSVKNRIIFNFDNYYNPFFVPSINVLAYENVGLNRIRLEKGTPKRFVFRMKSS